MLWTNDDSQFQNKNYGINISTQDKCNVDIVKHRQRYIYWTLQGICYNEDNRLTNSSYIWVDIACMNGQFIARV